MPIKTITERPLRQEEVGVIHWMLRHASRGGTLDHLIPTVDGLRVVGICDCGCPSIDFEIGGRGGGTCIIADAPGTSPEGFYVDLILWSKGEVITALEVCSPASTFTLPRIEALRTWEQYGKEYAKA